MKAREQQSVSTAIANPPLSQTNESLSRLFAGHYGRALAAAYRVVGNMADAEDVAQSLFLRLGRGEMPPVANVGGYLYRAAVNGALDLLRQRKPEETLEVVGAVEGAGPGSSPESAAIDRELGRILRHAISELAPRSAEMFVLRYLEEMDNREIAAMMGTSPMMVAVTLYQARSKLKKKLADVRRGIR